jgi:serine/threonine protein phosphatase 1
MSGRTLAIGDIHGGLRALEQVLQRAKVTPDDLLIFLGDYVDGWSESPQVLDFLMQLRSTHRCLFLRGNHDELLLEWFKTGVEKPQWLRHGGRSTLQAYASVSADDKARHAHFLEHDLLNYFLQDNQQANQRLFLHAGFTHIRGFQNEYFKPMLYWDRSLWECAVALDPTLTQDSPRYPSRLKLYAEVFIGHTPTIQIGSSVPVQAACVWNLDTGAGFTGPLTIMDVDSKAYWQSDDVISLYPGEEPRVV